MPKHKSHKGLLKRVRVTGRGKLKHKRSGSSHLMGSMNAKKKRNLRRPLVVTRSVAKKMEGLLNRRLKGREQD